MKKTFFIIFCISCGIALKANVFNPQILTKDTSIKSAAQKFLNWYFDTYKSLDDTAFNFKLVSGGDYDTLNSCRVDFKSTTKYLKALEKTGMFSPKFIKSMTEYFVRCDSNFVHYKQYCGIPMGFEEGVLVRYMDDTGIEENKNNFKIVAYKKRGNTVFVKLKFTKIDFFTFEFTEYNGKWLIDKINGDFSTEIQHNYNFNSGCK